MKLARATSPRTVLQRHVDRMQMLADVAGAFDRVGARMEAGLAAQRREPAPPVRSARVPQVPEKGRSRKRRG
jgi:hypothetical protein